MTRSIERDVDIVNQRVATLPIAGWVGDQPNRSMPPIGADMCGAVGAGRLAVVSVRRSPELEAVVAGAYDVIGLVTAEDFDSLAKLSVSEIQVVDGVTRTLTCSVAHL